MEERKKVGFVTLGCKVNQYETEAMKNVFLELGYAIAAAQEKADVYLVNTCAVTNLSAAKSRQAIRRLHKNNPLAKIIVVGCYAQAEPDEIIAIEGVSLVLGTKEKDRLADFLTNLPAEGAYYVGNIKEATEFSQLSAGDYQERTRAFIKIQEGCEQFCSYCLIPYLRGPVRSRPLPEVINEAKRLVREGFEEIVLIGIHIGVYGEEKEDYPKLAELLRELVLVDGLKRIRLGSLEPTDFSDELLEVVSNSAKICPHFHIPLQSGSDSVLRAMNRRYDTAFYAGLIDRIREKIPLAAIATDLMVGFPGETEADFQSIVSFVKRINFSRIHVFPYSKRPGTPAAVMPGQILTKEKERRSRIIRSLASDLARQYAEKFVGRVEKVLVEDEKSGLLEGLTPHYIRTFFPGSAELIGRIVPVKITEVREGLLYGERAADFTE